MGSRMCPKCKVPVEEKDIVGHEYAYSSPHHYDGVSEWVFPCGHRVGRWSRALLEDGEVESRYGVQQVLLTGGGTDA